MKTIADPRVDTKAGLCSSCRTGSHALCASPVCTCPRANHQMRPTAAGRIEHAVPPGRERAVPPTPDTVTPPPLEETGTGERPVPPPGREVTFGLVWEDPPTPEGSGRKGIADKVRPVLDDLTARPQVWAHIASFPHPKSARSAVTACKKKHGPVFQFTSADGRLYARYAGAQA